MDKDKESIITKASSSSLSFGRKGIDLIQPMILIKYGKCNFQYMSRSKTVNIWQ
jgi:hypothetical protein